MTASGRQIGLSYRYSSRTSIRRKAAIAPVEREGVLEPNKCSASGGGRRAVRKLDLRRPSTTNASRREAPADEPSPRASSRSSKNAPPSHAKRRASWWRQRARAGHPAAPPTSPPDRAGIRGARAAGSGAVGGARDRQPSGASWQPPDRGRSDAVDSRAGDDDRHPQRPRSRGPVRDPSPHRRRGNRHQTTTRHYPRPSDVPASRHETPAPRVCPLARNRVSARAASADVGSARGAAPTKARPGPRRRGRAAAPAGAPTRRASRVLAPQASRRADRSRTLRDSRTHEADPAPSICQSDRLAAYRPLSRAYGVS